MKYKKIILILAISLLVFPKETYSYQENTKEDVYEEIYQEEERDIYEGDYQKEGEVFFPEKIRVGEEESIIEEIFQETAPREIIKKIKQFGYDIFKAPVSTFTPLTEIPVGPDYILGPEDELTIFLWGMKEEIYKVKIDREGCIFIPTLGKISLWGLNFLSAKELIKRELSKYYKDFNVDITLSKLRTIKVFIVGSVLKPGGYELSSLATLFNALYLSGGPSKMGSLRRIKLIRNNETILISDFYNFLLKGEKKEDIRLHSGDTVFVPPIGPVVGINGMVKRPAIYELKEEKSLKELIEMAGGLLPFGYQKNIQIEVSENGKNITSFSLAKVDWNWTLRDGSLVRITPEVLPQWERIETVLLKGEVKLPGRYRIRKGERLGSLLKRAGGFTDEAFLPGAIFTRLSAKKAQKEWTDKFFKASEEKYLKEIAISTKSSEEKEMLRRQKELISFLKERIPTGRVVISLKNLEELRSSSDNIFLEDGDTLYIPRIPSTVMVMGGVYNSGLFPYEKGKRLMDYLEKAGGLNKSGVKKEIYLVKSNGTAVKKFIRIKDIEPGDTIVVPEELRKGNWEITKEVIQVIYQVGLTAAAFNFIF